MNEEMHFDGLTDLPQTAAQDFPRCRCGSVARVASGLCVSCLLQNGLAPTEEINIDDFDALLASIDVPDRDWQLGNYRILEEIGRGGMGVIYRARHTPSQRIVALKRVLNYHSDSRDTLLRFQREATAAASLDHPNILPIFDVGATEDGLPFFSMKFAAGGSLLHARDMFRTPRCAAQLIATVASAVFYAHSQGILHRDLKPGNILLDARGEPMVSDFGLAKWLDSSKELTRTLTVFGTPGYIAPEQAEGSIADLTPAADIYSLGAILFELLSGRPPFLGEHALAVVRQASENEAPKLRSLVPNAPRDLETICARCLEREPHLRYQSAAALAEELERWLRGRPIKARPVWPPARIYRWTRRNPVLATTLAICLLFTGGIATRQVQNWKLQAQLRQAELARNSVVVMPFLDLDNATEKPDWSATFGQDLQREMSAFGNAKVVFSSDRGDARMATRNFRTRAALFGTSRKINNGMQVSLHLVGSDNQLLWGRIIHSSATSDLKPLIQNITPAIYAVLAASDWSTLLASKRDPALLDPQARELMSAGRELAFHSTSRDLDRAMSCFEKALNLAPGSALAHAYLASAAGARTHYAADLNLLSYAEREIEEAFRLAPDSGEVLRILAGVNYQKGDLGEALEMALAAIERNALDGTSFAMLAMIYDELGRPDLALRWLELARSYDSRPGQYDCHIGDCWAALGDYEKAKTAYRRAVDLHPERTDGIIGVSRLYLLSADFGQARNALRQDSNLKQESNETLQLAAQIEFFARNFAAAERLYKILDQKDPDGGSDFYGSINYRSALGRMSRNSKASQTILNECLTRELKRLKIAPKHPEILYRVSAIESSLGKTESALEHLEAAVSAGWIDYRSLSFDPRFDNISEDSRFQTILGKLKLKVETILKSTETDHL